MLYNIENITYDDSNGIIHKNGAEFELTKLQRKLLNFYINHPNTIHSKNAIMKNVWGKIVTSNSVDQINSILRNHLENNPKTPKIIVSHFGKGVSFEGSVNAVRNDESIVKQTNKRAINKYYVLILMVILISGSLLLGSNFKTTNHQKQPIKPQIEPVITQPNRLIFLPSKNIINGGFDINTGTQMVISELLRFSSDSDIVDTSSYKSIEKKQQLANNLWHLNPNLNLVKTHLSEQDETFKLDVEIINGKNFSAKQEFTGTTIYDVVLKAVTWISEKNTHQSLDENLLNLLPNNKYLVETYMRGFSYLNSGDQKKAIEYFKLCLQEKSDFHLARFSLAHALRRFSKYDEAIVQLQTLKSFKLASNLAIAVDSEFAAIELIRGNLDNAKIMFEKVINEYPLSFRLYPAYMNLAATEYRMGHYEQALKQLSLLEKVIDENTHPEDAAIVAFTSSGAYMYQNKLDKSYFYLQKSLRLFKQSNDLARVGMILSRISNYYKMIGDLTQADEYIQRSYAIANQLDNKRSQMAALNHMVEFNIIKGKFDEASKLNQSLANLASEMNLLAGKISSTQWDAELSIEKKNYPQAQKFIEKHLRMAQERDSKPSLETNLILQLKLALAIKDKVQADEVIKDLHQLPKEDALQDYFTTYYIDYLIAYKPKEVRAYLLDKLKQADQQKNTFFEQYLTLKLAENTLINNPSNAIKMLQKMNTYDQYNYPFYSIYAKALLANGQAIEALVQMEKAKQTYYQRWDQELQSLYLKIKSSITQITI